MEKLRVGVVFGGRSGEHEVSVRSAATVIAEIDKARYRVVPVHITKEGKWLDPHASLSVLPEKARSILDGTLEGFPTGEVGLSGSAGVGGLSVSGGAGNPQIIPIDVFFPVLHGTYGEDGTIQGLFEMADIPYVGCGVVASSCGMDKVVMKTMFVEAGLPICRHLFFLRSEWESDSDRIVKEIVDALGFPCFVKPANLGSSVGVSRADDEKGLREAFRLAAEFDRKVIVEECLDMREIECAVLGNDVPKASLPGEYVVKDETKKFLDYTEKYAGTGNNEFVVPSPISEDLSDAVREMSIRAFKSIDGTGLARVDFFLRRDTGELLINEINTMPGLTDSSGYPKMWQATGLGLTAVVDELIELALARHRDKARNRTCL